MRPTTLRLRGLSPLTTSFVLIAALSLTAAGCCCPEQPDETWQCYIEEDKEFDLHIGVIPYKERHPFELQVFGNVVRAYMGAPHAEPVTMTLEPKVQEGRRRYVSATVEMDLDGFRQPPEVVAMLFKTSKDGKSMEISELKDVDWSQPQKAKKFKPMHCTR